MGEIGPVGIAEVRKVLTERLRMLAVEPPARRFGRVFVGSPEQARGRAFRSCSCPASPSAIFPQKLREDPLFLDDGARALDGGLRASESAVVTSARSSGWRWAPRPSGFTCLIRGWT